jgi:hypothetical protein
MERWIDGRAGEVERELAEGHLEECARCRAEVADLELVSKEGVPRAGNGSPWRWLLPLAALVALAFAGVSLFQETAVTPADPRPIANRPVVNRPAERRTRLIKPPIVAALAGTTIELRGSAEAVPLTLLEPAGTLIRDARPQFRWTEVPGASSYEITIVEAGREETIAAGKVRAASWQPDTPLPQGRTYSWQVTASVDGQRVTAPRPPAGEVLFRTASAEQLQAIAARETRLTNDHLRLGIAFAEEGFLDDAERELTQAGAGELLAQVRSWRRADPSVP